VWLGIFRPSSRRASRRCGCSSCCRFAELRELSGRGHGREFRVGTIDPAAPSPSVEAILHAIVPLSTSTTRMRTAILRADQLGEWRRVNRSDYGRRLLHIPYVMPGFKLAALFADLYPREFGAATIGNGADEPWHLHLAPTARESYERMIDMGLTGRAYSTTTSEVESEHRAGKQACIRAKKLPAFGREDFGGGWEPR